MIMEHMFHMLRLFNYITAHRVQVFKRVFHTYIHLDYSRVELFIFKKRLFNYKMTIRAYSSIY